MGCWQQESSPSPALVTIISVPHLVHWYRLPTWFATVDTPSVADWARRPAGPAPTCAT